MRVGEDSRSFPKYARLLGRADFRRVYAEGQRRRASLCKVFLRPNGLPQSRLGITTPSALGNAVVRNRVRRRLREVFRLQRASLPGGWDIVVNPRAAVASVPFTSLERQFLRMMPRERPTENEER